MSARFATARCRLDVEPSAIGSATAEVWLLLVAQTAIGSTARPTGRSDLFRVHSPFGDRGSGSKRPTSLGLEAPLTGGSWVLAAAAVVVEPARDREPRSAASGRRGGGTDQKRAAPSSVGEFAERLGTAMADSESGTTAGATFPRAGITVREPAAGTLLAGAVSGIPHRVLADGVSETRLRRDRAFLQLERMIAAGRGRVPSPTADPTSRPGGQGVVIASGLVARLVGASFGTDSFELDVDLSPRPAKGESSARLRGRVRVEVSSGLSTPSADQRRPRRPVQRTGARGAR